MKMKQITLSLAGVLAAIAFAPEASAVPVFARQTGMACSACHFNHFPLLNPFGRAFKSSAYTLMGSQGKVEGENLSLPDRLNMAMLATAGHQSVSDANNGAAPTPGANGWFVPGAGGELNLFIGGKVTDMSGFLSEFGMGSGSFNATKGLSSASGKLLILPEVADGIHAGLVIYQIGQDAAGSFELLNTGATSIHRLMGNPGNSANGGQHIRAYSARQYVAQENSATGITGVVAAENFFVDIGRYASVDASTGLGSASNLPGQYVRAVYMWDLAGFDTAVGLQNWSGIQNATTDVTGIQAVTTEERATVVDFQMQGEVGGKGLAIYASYGRAPRGTVALSNTFNPSVTNDVKSFNVGVDYAIIPKFSLQGAFRSATNGAGQSDNAFMIGGVYDLAMNQHLSLNYTTQSGDSWNSLGANFATQGKNNTTLLLESFF